MSSSEEEYRPSGKKAGKKAGKGKGSAKAPAKPAKDPNKPKAPITSYMRFVNEKRAEIKKDNPDAGIGDVAKIAGKMWKELSDDDKAVYENAYKKEREAYNKLMEDYEPPAGMKRSKPKAAKDPNAPKKPLTAYFMWMNANRDRIKKENPDAGLGEIAKIAGAEWKDVDADEKAELEATYRENMEEYKEKMKSYTPSKKSSPAKKAKKAPAKKKAKKSAEIYDDSSDGGNSTSSLSD